MAIKTLQNVPVEPGSSYLLSPLTVRLGCGSVFQSLPTRFSRVSPSFAIVKGGEISRPYSSSAVWLNIVSTFLFEMLKLFDPFYQL